MTSDTADYVANVVARRIGVPVDVEFVSAELLRIIPAGIHKHEGFSVEIRTGWRHAEAAFVPGTFARPLIVRMGEAAPESRAAFMALAAEPMLPAYFVPTSTMTMLFSMDISPVRSLILIQPRRRLLL